MLKICKVFKVQFNALNVKHKLYFKNFIIKKKIKRKSYGFVFKLLNQIFKLIVLVSQRCCADHGRHHVQRDSGRHVLPPGGAAHEAGEKAAA